MGFKDEEDDQKENQNIPPNVRKYDNQLIEDAIAHNKEEIPIKIVTKNKSYDYNYNDDNDTNKNITLDNIIMQEEYNTPNIDSLKKEENNIDQIMENVVEENKEEEKMKTTFNLNMKYTELKSKKTY